MNGRKHKLNISFEIHIGVNVVKVWKTFPSFIFKTDKQAHSTKHLALDQPHLSIMRSKRESAKLGYKCSDGDNNSGYICRKT